MTEPHLTRTDLQSAVGASRELGRDYDEAIAANLASQVERIIDARVAQGLALRGQTPTPLPAAPSGRGGPQLALAITSLALSIPLTAIAMGTGSYLGVIIVWIGIVLVNFAYGRGRN
ncbi:MAG TPA: hypothetical protein VLR88_02140 [Propionibacteriaceae bacterium]|nr:hypothetical protein [Propionibacteriaceae bacterium]